MSEGGVTSDALRGGRSYRRGSILGLTIAETFMLITFALLMLLLLWKVQEEKALAATRDFAELAQRDREALLDLVHGDSEDDLRRLREAGLLGADSDALLRLVERVAELPVNAKSGLTALLDNQEQLGDLAALAAQSISPEEIAGALALAKTFDVSELEDLRGFKSRIEDNLGDKARAKAAFVDALERELGDLVARIGGTIDGDGAITLPDDLLFATGSSTIKPRLGSFLDGACRPWFDLLHASSAQIREVRIEGHASSEWRRDTPEAEAYFHNLRLSQERSRAVLEACLRRVDGTVTGDWARANATAAGYSSSRLILDADGEEDMARSRRVVFRASIRTDDIVDNIAETLTE